MDTFRTVVFGHENWGAALLGSLGCLVLFVAIPIGFGLLASAGDWVTGLWRKRRPAGPVEQVSDEEWAEAVLREAEASFEEQRRNGRLT